MAYRIGDIVHVRDKMQSRYSYAITEPAGENFAPDFTPHFTPKEMLPSACSKESTATIAATNFRRSGLPKPRPANNRIRR